MFPMPALRRKTAGAFVMLFCMSPVGPVAERGLAQTLVKPHSGPAQPGPTHPASAEPAPAATSSNAQPSPALPAAAPVLSLPGALQHKAAPAKPEQKSIPKPGPGANDAGQAATALRTIKLSLVGLIDRSVIGREKGEIGHVIDVLVDAKGQPSALVVDVGGFMGMGNRRIAIAWERFALAGRKPKDALQLPLSDAQVKAAPAYDGSENVTVVQDSIEPPAAKPSHRAPGANAFLDPSRVDLGEGLASTPDQRPDPLNPD